MMDCREMFGIFFSGSFVRIPESYSILARETLVSRRIMHTKKRMISRNRQIYIAIKIELNTMKLVTMDLLMYLFMRFRTTEVWSLRKVRSSRNSLHKAFVDARFIIS